MRRMWILNTGVDGGDADGVDVNVEEAEMNQKS